MSPQRNNSKSRRPSVAAIVAVMALVVAMGGTAVAGSDLARKLDAKEQKQVKKIAKKQAGKVVTSRAPGLSVDQARTADSATTAATADSANVAEAIAADSVKAGSIGTLTERQVTEQIADGTGESASVTCNPDEQMITGGTGTAGVGTEAGWSVIRSGPDPNGWTAAARNDSGDAASLIVSVMCLGA